MKCKRCGHEYELTARRKRVAHYRNSFCANPKCRKAHARWLEANWDQIEEGSTSRGRYEREFWELNDTQREHYKYFLSMVHPKPKLKVTKCLKCNHIIDNRKNTAYNSMRICHNCQRQNNKYRTIAEEAVGHV